MQFRNGTAVLLLFLGTTVSSYAQSASGKQSIPHPSEGDPVYHKLDFWVGKWDIYDNHDGTLNGTDIVEKIVGGCALIENWREADGSGEGKSLSSSKPKKYGSKSG
jgi:hypothetical protein